MGLWGWMSAFGPGEMTEIEGRLTSHQYVDILEHVMLPSVRAMLIPPPQQIYIAMDNAPIHNSQAVKEWFTDHPEVSRISWPPKSPDMMPIEHLWAKMTKKWDENVPRNKENLILHAKQIWDEIRSEDLCHKLVMSMPHRIRELVNKGGYSTKY